MSESDKIIREVIIKAPVSKVWRALTDHREFGTWFKAEVSEPFRVGERSKARMTIEGFEHLKWEVEVLKMDEPKLFAFKWPPYVENAKVDISKEPWQLVEFSLEEVAEGTKVTLTESGFNLLTPGFREDARRGNEQGWAFQMKNLDEYVTKK